MKLTPDLAARYCEHLAAGLPRTRAARLVGLDPATVFRWLALARTGRGGPHFASFATDVAWSEAQFIAAQVAVVVRAARPRRVRTVKTVTRPDGGTTTVVTERMASDWQVARWLLESKEPEAFGPDRHALAAVRRELTDLRAQWTGRPANSATDSGSG